MRKQHHKYIIKSSRLGPLRHPGLPVYSHLQIDISHQGGARTPSSHTSTAHRQGKHLKEGGRSQVTLLYGSETGSELHEYVAIRIVFTLQGLYRCTHSPKASWGGIPGNFRASVYYHETNGYGHHPVFPGLGASSRERSPRGCEASPCCVGAHEDQYPFTPGAPLY